MPDFLSLSFCSCPKIGRVGAGLSSTDGAGLSIVDNSLSNLGKSIEVFSTRPDTIFGATFCALSPFHPLVDSLIQNDNALEIKVRESLFIAHSLKDDFFGPAKNLHGATYVVDLIIKSRTLDNHNVVCDIEFAHNILKDCIAKYNYLNLDDIDELKDKITTTEFMARQLVEDFEEKIHILKDSKIFYKINKKI